MKSKGIVVYGRRLLSKMLYFDAIDQDDFVIVAFCVDREYLDESGKFCELPQVAFEDVEMIYPPSEFDMVVLDASLSQDSTLFYKAKEKGYHLRNYISKRSVVFNDLKIGENNIIFELCYIGPETVLHDNNIIRQKVYIGHELKMGSHVIITASTTIGGVCTIDDKVYIGLNSTISNNIHIKQKALIGAGSVVIRDVEENTKNVGNPSHSIGVRFND